MSEEDCRFYEVTSRRMW